MHWMLKDAVSAPTGDPLGARGISRYYDAAQQANGRTAQPRSTQLLERPVEDLVSLSRRTTPAYVQVLGLGMRWPPKSDAVCRPIRLPTRPGTAAGAPVRATCPGTGCVLSREPFQLGRSRLARQLSRLIRRRDDAQLEIARQARTPFFAVAISAIVESITIGRAFRKPMIRSNSASA